MKSNRLQLHTPSSSATVNWGKYQAKKYLHFDTPLSIERVRHLIEDPIWVRSHAFFPFIHFEMIYNKYVLKGANETEKDIHSEVVVKTKEKKTRSIMSQVHNLV